jgi:multidrug efflux pump subunit AcrA (membrane-fusion protein)
MVLASLLALGLIGCAGRSEETPIPDLDLDYVPVVSVTGEVVPEVWATVSAQEGGTVVEILVEPGDEVAEGDLLARLDPADAQLGLRRAEAALQIVRAQLESLLAGPREEEIAMAEAEVEAAEAALIQAAAQLDQLAAGMVEAEIAAAEAQVTVAQAEELAAREAHELAMKCYEFTLPDGTEDFVCPLLGPPEEQARYNLQVATEALDAAQAQLDALVAGAANRISSANSAVTAASAQRDVAQAQLDLLEAGATAEEIGAARAAISQAQAALETARVALERTEVRAPLAGVVGMVKVRTGELVTVGQPLFVVGDLNTLRVETTDLDEIDVARVEIGQQASISLDALPEQVFTGRVSHISPMAEPGAGGVNYSVVIEVDAMGDAIRWGMTAFVDIEVE